MVDIQLRKVPKGLDKEVAKYKIDHECKSKAEAIKQILNKHFMLRGDGMGVK